MAVIGPGGCPFPDEDGESRVAWKRVHWEATSHAAGSPRAARPLCPGPQTKPGEEPDLDPARSSARRRGHLPEGEGRPGPALSADPRARAALHPGGGGG